MVDSLLSYLRNLVTWSTDWQMLFNTDKCKVLHFGYNNSRAEYLIGGNKLQKVKEEKALGVVVSSDLKWEKQCSEAVKKGE